MMKLGHVAALRVGGAHDGVRTCCCSLRVGGAHDEVRTCCCSLRVGGARAKLNCGGLLSSEDKGLCSALTKHSRGKSMLCQPLWNPCLIYVLNISQEGSRGKPRG